MVIYDAHNVEKERVNSGALSTSNLFLKAITKLVLILSESLAVRCSDCVLSISYRDKRKFMETYEVAPEKIKVVYPSLSQASQKYQPINLLRYFMVLSNIYQTEKQLKQLSGSPRSYHG